LHDLPPVPDHWRTGRAIAILLDLCVSTRFQ
jgi:hypothetical protein